MKITKKYILEHIKLIRSNIIDIWGETRDLILMLEGDLKSERKINLDDFEKINKRINRQLKLFDEENTKIVTDSKLEDNDIRLILGGMNIVSNFEKISIKIIRFINLYNNHNVSKYSKEISEIVNKLVIMFDKLFIGFAYSEIDNCYETINDDKDIDKLRDKNKSDIVQDMMKNENLITTGLNIIYQLDILERIGDYIVYISKEIVYILTGEDIRYSEKK